MNSPLSGIRQLFRHKDYSYYVIGQLAVVLGFWMQSATSSWLMYEMTDSAFLLGAVMFCLFIPALLFSPFAGMLVDKYTKKYILYCTQILACSSSFFMAVLLFTDTIAPWNILFNAFVMGTVISIEGPCRNAFMIELVGKDELQNAIAFNSSLFNLGRMVGPAIGGLLMGFIDASIIYLINSFAFLFLCYILYKISVYGKPSLLVKKEKSLLRDGFSYVYSDKGISYALIQVAFISIAVTMVSTLLPIIAKQVLTGESILYGMLYGASGFGAFCSALLLAGRTKQTGLLYWIEAGLYSLLLGFFLLAISTNVFISLIALVFIGIGSVLQVTPVNTLLQLLTSDEYRGRVLSFFLMMWMGVGVLGAVLAGILNEYLGFHLTMWICLGITFTSLTFLQPKIKRNTLGRV